MDFDESEEYLEPREEILFKRLRGRNTESAENLRKRINRATEELTYERKFDRVLLNDDLDVAKIEAEDMVTRFLNETKKS